MKKLTYLLLVYPAVLCAQPGLKQISFPDANLSKELTLETCKKLAEENSYRIKEADNEILQSELLKKNAFTNYFPKINAGFSAVRLSDYLAKSSIPQMDLPVYDGNIFNLLNATQFAFFPPIPLNLVDYMNIGYASAVQPLFSGGRIYHGNKLARTGYEISCDKKSLAVTEVLLKTEELYWDITARQEQLSTIDSYLKLLENLNKDVTLAYDAGLAQKTDLLKVRLKQNEQEMNRLKLVNGIELSKKALCQNIGIPYDSMIVLMDSVVIITDPADLIVSPGEAVKNRDEYRILEKALQAEKLQRKMVTGEYLPRVAAGAAALYTDFMDKTDEIGALFITVSVPISDWWGGTHKIKQSTVKIRNAVNRLDETSELLSLQIAGAQNELKQNYLYIDISQKSLEQARENLKVTRDNYDAGITGMSDLLEAESVYQSALNSLTEAKCNYQISRAKYLQTINAYK